MMDPSPPTTPPSNPVAPHIGDPELEDEYETDDDNGDDLDGFVGFAFGGMSCIMYESFMYR